MEKEDKARQFKKQVHKLVPKEVQSTSDFTVLLSVIDKESIADSMALRLYLAKEMSEHQELLKRTRVTSTENRLRSKHALWLDALKRIRTLSDNYLR